MKKFAFLFPDKHHFDIMIEWGSYGWENYYLKKKWNPLFASIKTEEEREILKQEFIGERNLQYSSYFFNMLNKCIKERYRKKDFEVNWISLDNEPVSSNIEILSEDKIILSGVDFKWGPKKKKTLSGYPDFSLLVDKIGDCEHLRIGGHVIWDCVSKLAKEAHERRLDVLVDEDLTDFFQSRISEPLFKIDVYPSINFKKWYTQRGMVSHFEEFMNPRKDKPWFYQNY